MPTFTGVVDAKGALHLDATAVFRAYLSKLANAPIELIVRRKRSKRSLPQNRRYWALLTCAAESLGWDDVEQLHEEVAYSLLKLPNCEKTGLRRRMRTPKLNTNEFTVYMDRAEALLVDFGADLSDWGEHEAMHKRAA